MFQVTQQDGRRRSTADAFLRPALKRSNLKVMTRTRVLRVEFEGGGRSAYGSQTGIDTNARFERRAR